MQEYFRLVDIGREEYNELAGGQGNIIHCFFGDIIEGEVFFGVIRGSCGLIGQGRISKSFGAGDDDLDVGIIPVTFGVTFGKWFGRKFVYDGKNILSVDLILAGLHSREVCGEAVLNGFFKVRADDLVPVQLG